MEYPQWKSEIRVDPPSALCVECGSPSKLGSVYYHCEQCNTLGYIGEDGKVYPVSGPASILDKYR